MSQILNVVQIHTFVSTDMYNKIRYFVHLAVFQYICGTLAMLAVTATTFSLMQFEI